MKKHSKANQNQSKFYSGFKNCFLKTETVLNNNAKKVRFIP